MDLTIYRSGSVLSTVKVGEDTVLEAYLMGDNRVSAVFSSPVPIVFMPGDYIIENGMQYSIRGNDMPRESEEGDRRFVYQCLFKAPQYQWADVPAVHLGEPDFTYFATPSQALNLLLDCVNEFYPTWSISSVAVKKSKLLSFDNMTCMQALAYIADQFGLEFSFGNKTVELVEEVSTLLPGSPTFEYGKGNGLYTLTQIPVPEIEFGTRWYGYGGTRNVPVGYLGGRKRLAMTGMYVEENVGLYGVIPRSVIFDDVIPERTGTLTEVISPTIFKDDSLDFDLNDVMVTGASVVFNSGYLGGQEFEILTYDHSSKTISLKAKELTNGQLMPNGTSTPTVGDEYVIVGITLPNSYVVAAENEVAQLTAEHASKHSHPTVGFELFLDELFVDQHSLERQIMPGAKLHVKSTKMLVDRLLRVNEISYPLSNPRKIQCQISDKVAYSVAERLVKSITEDKRKVDDLVEQSKELVKKTTAKFVTLTGDQVFTYGNDINQTVDKPFVTLVAMEHNFIAAPVDRLWEYYNGVAWIQIPDTFNVLNFNLSHNNPIWSGNPSVTIRYRVNDLYDQMTIVKLYSSSNELTVVITSDYGDIFFNGHIDTWLRATVYFGGDNITDTIPASGFQWTRTSADPGADEVWNYHEGRDKKEVHIDETDVIRKAVFECEVTVNI